MKLNNSSHCISELEFLAEWWSSSTCQIYTDAKTWAKMGSEHAVLLLNHSYEGWFPYFSVLKWTNSVIYFDTFKIEFSSGLAVFSVLLRTSENVGMPKSIGEEII